MPEKTTNTFGGINLTAVAQDTIKPLTTAMIPFNAFTTNFSDEIMTEGAAVVTRLPSAITFGSLATGYSTNAQNTTLTAKTCTLGAVTGAVVGFSDAEVSMSSVDLMGVFIDQIVTGVANDAMDDLLALITNSAFTGNSSVTAANFDLDDVADLANELSADSVPFTGRSLILENAYTNALRKDNALLANTLGSTEVVRNGVIGRLMGLDVYEYTDIPATAYDGETVKGFACGKTGLLIAARTPAVPSDFKGQIANVTDPVSGFTLQLRSWYSEDQGQYYLSGAGMWGVAAGDPAALHVLRSA